MALTQQDLQAIKSLIDNSINNALTSQDKRLDQKLQDQDHRFDQKLQDQDHRIDQKLQKNREEIADAIFEYIDKTTASKQDLAEIKKRLANLPDKNDFYQWMDQITGDYKTFDTEAPNIASKLSDHDNRIEKIETHLALT